MPEAKDAPAKEAVDGGDSAPVAGGDEEIDPAVAEAEKAAVAEALGLEGDRLDRMMDALEVVGVRAPTVKLVRVLSGDKEMQRCKSAESFLSRLT